MKIKKIAATAGRTFNHPHEQYANFRFDLHFEAALDEAALEDPQEALKLLQSMAEQRAEQHKTAILADIRKKSEIEQVLQNIESEKRLNFDNEASKKRLAEYEERLSQLTATPLLLAQPTIHPGHEDHPDTEEEKPFWES